MSERQNVFTYYIDRKRARIRGKRGHLSDLKRGTFQKVEKGAYYKEKCTYQKFLKRHLSKEKRAHIREKRAHIREKRGQVLDMKRVHFRR